MAWVSNTCILLCRNIYISDIVVSAAAVSYRRRTLVGHFSE